MYGSRHGKYHDPGMLGFHCFAEAAGTIIFEIVDDIDFPSAATRRKFSITFRTRECQCLGLNNSGYSHAQSNDASGNN